MWGEWADVYKAEYLLAGDLVETKLTEASSIVSHLLAGVHDAGQPPSALHRGAPHALVEADVRKN